MNWFGGSIPEAIGASRQKRCIFVVVVTDDSPNSTQLLANMEDPRLSQVFSQFVSIHLINGSIQAQQFSQLYPLVVLPSIYMIGLQGTPLEVVGGLVDCDALLSSVNKALQLHNSSQQLLQQTPQQLTTEKPPEQPTQPEPTTEQAAGSSSVEPVAVDAHPSMANPEATGETISEADQESVPVVTPSNQLPLDDRVERAQELLAAIRIKKEHEEREKEKERERQRRELGKDLQKFKEAQKEREQREAAEARQREKREDKEALEKIRQQIAQDRADRAARYQAAKVSEEERKRTAQAAQEQLKQERASAARSAFARLQFRLPDGTTRTEQFASDVLLQHVVDFIDAQIQPPFKPYFLCTTFPRRQFHSDDLTQTLRDLDLAPSAALLIVPQTTTGGASGGGSLGSAATSSPASPSALATSWLTWLLFPVQLVFNFVWSFIFPTSVVSIDAAGAPPTAGAAAANAAASRQRTDETSSGAVRRRPVRQEGNVRRLVDASADDSSDDEQATWNGNSTQQL